MVAAEAAVALDGVANFEGLQIQNVYHRQEAFLDVHDFGDGAEANV